MLTETQIKAREGKLTASRVRVLMTGDVEGIMNLWREMTDDPTFVPDDLSQVWPVRLGECTEQLSLDWLEMKGGFPITRRGEVVVHPQHSWAAATLDGWCEELRCPCEAKHVGGREPLEVIIERYSPQMQWLMECTGAQQCALSVIMGANEPIVEFIPRDAEYADEMVSRGEQFMSFVKRRVPPVALPAVPAPIVAEKIIDMTTNNTWAVRADEWLRNLDAAETVKAAEKVLKSLVPADAKKCHGHQIQITRDRAGRLSLREIKQ